MWQLKLELTDVHTEVHLNVMQLLTFEKKSEQMK